MLGALRFEEPAYLAVYLALFTVLIALSVIDMETLRLPDRLVGPSVLVGVVVVGVSAVVDGSITPVAGALTGAAIYFGILLLTHLIHPAGMGFGDVKLAFLMGMALGWPTEGGLAALGRRHVGDAGRLRAGLGDRDRDPRRPGTQRGLPVRALPRPRARWA